MTAATTDHGRETDSMNNTRTIAAALVTVMAFVAMIACLAPAAPAAPAFDVSVTDDAHEVQEVKIQATGGQFRLTFDGDTTTDLPAATGGAEAGAPAVEAALNALPSINAGGGRVSVIGAGSSLVSSYQVSFDGGPLAHTDVPKLGVVDGTNPLVPFEGTRMISVYEVSPPGLQFDESHVDYKVKVRNVAPVNPSVGAELFCNGIETEPSLPKNWNPGSPGDPTHPAYSFQWLRNGVVVAGATSQTYVATEDDAGEVMQCLVTGTNSTAGATYASVPGVVVEPQPAMVPPAPADRASGGSRPTITDTGGASRTGTETGVCVAPANWIGVTAPYEFQWLRNGLPIEGAASATYTPVAADTNTQLQCLVRGTNAGGTLVGTSNHSIVGALSGNPNLGATQNPAVEFSNLTNGPVTLVVELPGGENSKVIGFGPDGSGWSCAKERASGAEPAKAICTRSDGLAAGASYPDLTIESNLGTEDPGAPAAATVSGGGAAVPATSGSAGFVFDPFRPFGIVDFDAAAVDATGADYTPAGGHPFSADSNIAFSERRSGTIGASSNVINRFNPSGRKRLIRVEIPRGFVGNMRAPTELCPSVQLMMEVPSGCPAGSVVGGVTPRTDLITFLNWPVYALEPERGTAALFGFADASNTDAVFTFEAKLRPGRNYAIGIDSAPAPASPGLKSVEVKLCSFGGAMRSHGVGGTDYTTFAGCRGTSDPGAFDKPLFTNPTRCSGPLQTNLLVDTWEDPNDFAVGDFTNAAISDCDQVPFGPSVVVAPTSTTVGSASGLRAEISVPVDGIESKTGVAQSHLKKTVVELPQGVSVNPSGATGLTACSDEQLGLGNDVVPSCPDGSKIGAVTVTTPVLEETFSGDMVLRSPRSTDPVSGEMLRMALIIRNDERGILVKLPGSATADSQTGRLVATFDDNPELPIDTIAVDVKGGDRGMLAMPQNCGEIATKSTLTPWSGGADAVSNTPATVGGDCSKPFAPVLDAGMNTKAARANGMFAFRFTRSDNEQWLRGLTAKLPAGLLASVKHVDLCSNAQADAGTCPLGSQIGIVDAKAGAGEPFVLEQKGRVYLTEGYKGGEYGLAVKIRPIAGPFRGAMELSPIIVRQAIHVDRKTAQVTAISDPFPLIHHGVPLRVREVTVLVDRQNFMLNPSDCARKQVGADIISVEGTVASLSNPFQASGCAALPFKPKLALRLTGRSQVRTGRHPGIRAQVTQQGVSEAGIEKAVVRLPKSLALDVNNAGALCEFVDGTKPDLENHCPKGSIVGRARAKTPLLKDDLAGNVYFVKNVRTDPKTGNEIRTLPMIIVALRGEISINLRGESDTTRAGKLVNTFNGVPDAPVSKFNLNIKGGSNGILAVTRTRRALINLCAKPRGHIAEADMDGHSGRRYDRDVRMKTPCSKRQVNKAKRAARKAARKARNARRS